MARGDGEWDHTRGCGAHLSPLIQMWPARGSPPRVRGSRWRSNCSPPTTGIIPAGAGLTSYIVQIESRNRDHPRGCGAHSFMPIILQSGSGSSPRVRGSLEDVDEVLVDEGIIPAGAGLTISSLLAERGTRDHPRGCGAHWMDRKRSAPHAGSSPRVRGSLGCILDNAEPLGIIPAGAGLTLLDRMGAQC